MHKLRAAWCCTPCTKAIHAICIYTPSLLCYFILAFLARPGWPQACFMLLELTWSLLTIGLATSTLYAHTGSPVFILLCSWTELQVACRIAETIHMHQLHRCHLGLWLRFEWDKEEKEGVHAQVVCVQWGWVCGDPWEILQLTLLRMYWWMENTVMFSWMA